MSILDKIAEKVNMTKEAAKPAEQATIKTASWDQADAAIREVCGIENAFDAAVCPRILSKTAEVEARPTPVLNKIAEVATAKANEIPENMPILDKLAAKIAKAKGNNLNPDPAGSPSPAKGMGIKKGPTTSPGSSPTAALPGTYKTASVLEKIAAKGKKKAPTKNSKGLEAFYNKIKK